MMNGFLLLMIFCSCLQIFSVFFFKGDAYLTAKLHSEVAPTFWYSFDYQGPVSMFNSLFPGEVPPFPGGGITDIIIKSFFNVLF